MTNTHKYETPLASVRGLGSAKTGTEHWWHQRLTSFALVPLTLWLVWSLISVISGGSYQDVMAWVATPLNATLLLLFVGVTFHHTIAGLEVVVEDYMHCECVKIATLTLIKFLGYGLTTACIYSIFRISFLAGA